MLSFVVVTKCRAARISSSESSSSFEIRHSNDPNTPRGIHLYFQLYENIFNYTLIRELIFKNWFLREKNHRPFHLKDSDWSRLLEQLHEKSHNYLSICLRSPRVLERGSGSTLRSLLRYISAEHTPGGQRDRAACTGTNKGLKVSR